MNTLIESRLKRMRRRVSFKDNSMKRKKSLNEWRKEKRQSIVNGFRRIDIEWFVLDITEDIEYQSNATDETKSVQLLIDFIDGNNSLNDFFAIKCFEDTKKLMVYNQKNIEDLIANNFLYKLSAFSANPLLSNAIKSAVLDVIEVIVSSIDFEVNKDMIINSGIILSAMIGFDSFDIQLLTKTVRVMKTIIAGQSMDISVMAIKSGYILFLMNTIKSINSFRNRRSTETKGSNRVSEMKLSLLKEISKSLHILTYDLTDNDLIVHLLPIFEKLIHFKDNAINIDVIASLNVIIDRKPEIICFVNKSLITFMNELMARSDALITSEVLHFWRIIIGKTNTSNENQFIDSLLIETNFVHNLSKTLDNIESNRLIKDISNVLNQFLDKTSFSVNFLLNSNVILNLINAIKVSDIYSRPPLVEVIIKMIGKIQSIQTLDYLLQNKITERLVSLLTTNDINVITITSEVLNTTLIVGQLFERRDAIIMRAQACGLDIC